MKGVQWIRTIGFVALLAAPRWLAAQDGVVGGTVVVSGSLRALPGVQVTVKGQTGKGAVSDAAGRFRIGGGTRPRALLGGRSGGLRPAPPTGGGGAAGPRVLLAGRGGG